MKSRFHTKLRTCGFHPSITTVLVVHVLVCPLARSEAVYVPGLWFDQDKYNRDGAGRGTNYWTPLGRGSDDRYYLLDTWKPGVGWKTPDGADDIAAYDFQSCDTNGNHAVDPGEDWGKFAWVDAAGPTTPGYYWLDINKSGALDDDDPKFVEGMYNFILDANGNHIEDENENWNRVQTYDDGSCWAAAGSNLMAFVNNRQLYHDAVYVEGVEHLDWPGVDGTKFWPEGGSAATLLDAYGYSDSPHYANIWHSSTIWEEGDNPLPGITASLRNGIPVAFSIQWGGGGRHAFAVYGIDTDAHTLLFADSDSDDDGRDFYEAGYRWVSAPLDGHYLEMDWDNDGTWVGDYIYGYVAQEYTTSQSGNHRWLEDAFVGLMGPNRIVSIGSDEWEFSTVVTLDPYTIEGAPPVTLTDAEAGRLLIQRNATLEAMTGTTLTLGSFHVKPQGRMRLMGSSLSVDGHSVCDGHMDLESGSAFIRHLKVGAQAQGIVNQSDGTIDYGSLALGWDTLQQGNLLISNGAYASSPYGEYNLNGGTLTADRLYVGGSDAAPGNGLFEQTGGVAVVNTGLVICDRPGSTGSYAISGGSLHVATVLGVPGAFQVGKEAQGLLALSGTASVEADGDLDIGVDAGAMNSLVTLGGDAALLVHGNERVGILTHAQMLQSTSALGSHTVEGTLSLAEGAGVVASYTLVSGRLTMGMGQIGVSGEATFSHRGGDVVAGTLAMAQNANSTGSYAMSGGTLRTTYNLIVGAGGQADFVQDRSSVTVGGNLRVGRDSGGSGSYTVHGVSVLSVAGDAVIGGDGAGTLHHDGGFHSVDGQLTLGSGAAGTGTYELVQGRVDSFVTVVGQGGTGTFTHSGGIHDVTAQLCLGRDAGSEGTYILSGGSVRAGETVVGSHGLGQFTHSAGDHTVDGDLVIASHAGSGGWYILSSGMLTTGRTIVGDDVVGYFTHDGGTHVVGGDLLLGRIGTGTGTYALNDGTLDARTGAIWLAQSSPFGSALIMNSGTIWADAIRLGNAASRIISSGGILHVNEMDLSLRSDQTYTFDTLYVGHAGGTSDGNVVFGADITVITNELAIGQASGKFASVGFAEQGSSSYRLQADTVYVGQESGSRGTLLLEQPGDAVSTHQYVGFWGEGQVVQSEGTNTLSQAYHLGFWPGSVGQYTLSGGTLESPEGVVGVGGEGTFTQTGGTHHLSNTLYIASGIGAQGRYSLQGGTLSAPTIDISGNGGNGEFIIQGASAPGLLTDELILRTGGRVISYNELGWGSHMQVSGGALRLDADQFLVLHGAGRVDLSAGSVLADYLTMGSTTQTVAGRTAIFHQTGGLASFPREAYIGNSAGTQAQYDLAGADATLNAGRFIVGVFGFGTVEQSAGTATLTQELALGIAAGGMGTYRLSGGTLQTPLVTIGAGGGGEFRYTGGSLHAANLSINNGGSMSVETDWNTTTSITVAGGVLHADGHSLTLNGPGVSTVSSGTLSADELILGHTATGELVHSGGEISALDIVVGSHQASGVFRLSGSALLNTQSLRVGVNGSDNVFCDVIQSGGSVFADTEVSLGGGTMGQYHISDGMLVTPALHVGDDNGGEFHASGGQVAATTLIVGRNSWGYMALSGDAVISTQVTRVGVGSASWVDQSGGALDVAGDLTVGEFPRGEEGQSTEYHLSGGAITSNQTWIGRNGAAYFNQTGGSHTVAQAMHISAGNSSSSGGYQHRAGSLSTPVLNIGTDTNSGSFTYTGGSLTAQDVNVAGQGTMIIGEDWTQTNGTIDISAGGLIESGTNHLAVAGGTITLSGGSIQGDHITLDSTDERSAVLQGFGTVSGFGDSYPPEFTKHFGNHGRVIADGGVLDLSDAQPASNNLDNPGDWGWYAQNQGVLKLPGSGIPTEDTWGHLVWGDDPDAWWENDLVNSVDMWIWDGAGPGAGQKIEVSVLALDRQIPAGLDGTLLGLWDFDLPAGMTFDNAELTIRYNHALLEAAGWLGDEWEDLQLVQYDGQAWSDVTDYNDADNFRIYSTTVGSDAEMYAVIAMDEAADLAITVDGPPSVATGATISLSCTVENLSQESADEAVFQLWLPDNATFVDSSPAGTVAFGILTIPLPSVGPGTATTVSLQFTAPGTAAAVEFDAWVDSPGDFVSDNDYVSKLVAALPGNRVEIRGVVRDPASGHLGLTIDSLDGVNYRVESSTNLESWQALPAYDFTGTGEALQLLMPVTLPREFFRLCIMP